MVHTEALQAWATSCTLKSSKKVTDMETLLRVLQYFVAGCVSFTSVCVATGWLIKIVIGIRKPKNDIDSKLQRDYDRLNGLDKEMKVIKEALQYLREAFNVQMETDRVILEHMRTNNSTGKIQQREDAIYDFLQAHQGKTH